jgi:hypothetical protein
MTRLSPPGWTGWRLLALAAAISMGLASAGGIWLPFVYVQETASWAAQGTGQDIVNLAVVLPAMLIALYAASAGSLRAVLVVLGLLIYLVYSYVLYAFFVHFNLLFPIYVAALGTSFWALVGIVRDVRHDQIQELFEGKTGRAQSAYLMISGLLFGVLWMSSIASSIASGDTPRDVVEVGLPVNPVHVLDLAFVLPAMVVTSILLWKRHPLGWLWAVPLLTFAAAMGSAIVGMMAVMKTGGLPVPGALIAAMAVSASLALYLAVDLLLPGIRHTHTIPKPHVLTRPPRVGGGAASS